jgi:hypothetical protein
MRRRVCATVRQLPATVIVFAVLAVALDGGALAVHSAYVSERPLWTGLWTMLGLWWLAALVIGRRRWAWWFGLLSPIGYLAAPAWGDPFHLLSDIVELVFLALLIIPSMRRHTGVMAGGPETHPAVDRWAPSLGWVSLGVSGALVLTVVLEDVTPPARSESGSLPMCSSGLCLRQRYGL